MTEPVTKHSQPQDSSSGDDESIKKLFHMSRTAGVGMADYAAVNGFAVGSIVLGLASSLTAIFHEPFLMILPALGLALGLLAYFQVRNSNGTQTGKLVAIGGI